MGTAIQEQNVHDGTVNRRTRILMATQLTIYKMHSDQKHLKGVKQWTQCQGTNVFGYWKTKKSSLKLQASWKDNAQIMQKVC